MAGYTYSDRQIQTYTEHAQAAVLWERAQHWEHNANYWKHRAQSAERRMLEHHCDQERTAPSLPHRVIEMNQTATRTLLAADGTPEPILTTIPAELE